MPVGMGAAGVKIPVIVAPIPHLAGDPDSIWVVELPDRSRLTRRQVLAVPVQGSLHHFAEGGLSINLVVPVAL